VVCNSLLDQHGRTTAVVLTPELWHQILEALEESEDRALVQALNPRIALGPVLSGALRWKDVSEQDALEAHYRAIVREVLVSEMKTPAAGGLIPITAMDDAQGQYMLAYVGWTGTRRNHELVLHIRIAEGKVFLEYDGTDITPLLVATGIPENDIIYAEDQPPTT
jgi:hypothetical protein